MNDDFKKKLDQEYLEKQKKVLLRSKWKARIQTAFSAIAIFLVFTILSSFLTAGYYSWGKPDRVDVLKSVIDHTLTVTNPYGHLSGTSTNAKPFFGLEATKDLYKKAGNETIKVGSIKVNFLFSLMMVPKQEYYGNVSQNKPVFSYPGAGQRHVLDWNKLERLPEGTVVSAYVSFSKLISTKEVFQLFEGKEIDLLWLAVDTGTEGTQSRTDGIIFNPIGFPSTPIWHDDDMILNYSQEVKGPIGSKTVTEGRISPTATVGDEAVLHKQFLKTLTFLKDHERKANNLYFDKLSLGERINYLKNKGIQHYGVVITGPTKEILKLQKETWVGDFEVDEVRFWNWKD